MNLVVLHHVWPSLWESADWYELERAGLGADLLREALSTLEAVAREPWRFPKVYRDARRAQTNRFPFGVFFVVRQNTVYVFGIVHLHRHPKHWKQHLPAKRHPQP